MGLDAPGVDPVADHTWCCEHPEPWNYFSEEAEARLLSGLSRVHLVDPVETSWSLRIAEWVASEAAIPVLEELLASNALPPKARIRCARLLVRVGGTTTELPEPSRVDARTFEELVNGLVSPSPGEPRWEIATEIVSRWEEAQDRDNQVRSLIEVVGIGHPGSDRLLSALFAEESAIVLTQEERTSLLLASAASGRPSGFQTFEALLEDSGPGYSIYDVYEGIRALTRTLPEEVGNEDLYRVVERLRERSWWRASNAEERGQVHVVEAALLGDKFGEGEGRIARWLKRLTTRGVKPQYQVEAWGFQKSKQVTRGLRTALGDPELFVRREAARSLRRQNTPEAVETLVEHVRSQMIPGHLPFDIEGADVIRAMMDLVVEQGLDTERELLFEVLKRKNLRAHDLPQRAALSLCFLEDERCMDLNPSSGLPEVIQAAICPLPSRSGDPLYGHCVRVARWVERKYGVSLLEGDVPLSHLARVRLSRTLVSLAQVEWTQDVREAGGMA